MGAVVQKWGNSQGIRIPKYILEEVGLRINDKIELNSEDDKIIIKKASNNSHVTLRERLETFYNKPIEEIKIDSTEKEVEWGKAEGEEIW